MTWCPMKSISGVTSSAAAGWIGHGAEYGMSSLDLNHTEGPGPDEQVRRIKAAQK